jgi:hypothetical protein
MLLLAAVLLGLLSMHATPAVAMPSPSAGPAAMAMPAMQQDVLQQGPVQQLPWHDGQGQHHLVSPCVSSPVRPAATGPVPPGTAPAASHVPAARPSTAPAVRLLRPSHLVHTDPQDLGICRT